MINAMSKDFMAHRYPEIEEAICKHYGDFKSFGLDPETGYIEIRHTFQLNSIQNEEQIRQVLEEESISSQEALPFFEYLNQGYNKAALRKLREEHRTTPTYKGIEKLQAEIKDERHARDAKRQREAEAALREINEQEKGKKRREKVLAAIHEKYDPIEISPVRGDNFSVTKDGKEYQIVCHVHFVRTRSGFVRKLEALDPTCFSVRFPVKDLPEEIKKIWPDSRQRLYRFLTGKKYQINDALRQDDYHFKVPDCIVGKFTDSEHLELEKTNGAVMKRTDQGFVFDRDSSGLCYQKMFHQMMDSLNDPEDFKYISASTSLVDSPEAVIQHWLPKDQFLTCLITIPDYEEDPEGWRDAIMAGVQNVRDQKKELDRKAEEKRQEERRRYEEKRRSVCLWHESDVLHLAICSIMKKGRGLSKGTITGALRGTKTHDDDGFNHNEYCGKFKMFSAEEIEEALDELSMDEILDAHEYKNDYHQWCTAYYLKDDCFDFTPLEERKQKTGDIPLFRRVCSLVEQDQAEMSVLIELLDDLADHPAAYCVLNDRVAAILKKSEHLPTLKKLIAMRKKMEEAGSKERKIYIDLEKHLSLKNAE